MYSQYEVRVTPISNHEAYSQWFTIWAKDHYTAAGTALRRYGGYAQAIEVYTTRRNRTSGWVIQKIAHFSGK